MIRLTVRKPIVFVATLVIAAGILAACSSAGDDTQSAATGVQPRHSGLRPPSPPTSSRRSIRTSTRRTGSRCTCWTAMRVKGRTGGLRDRRRSGDQRVDRRERVRRAVPLGRHAPRPTDRSSVDGLVAGLASQKSRHATAATDVTLDGFTGKYMELTVPARIDLADCDDGEFRTWIDPTGGARNLEPGQRDLLWIVDVDGSRLVIDAALGPDTTPQDRADRIQMVESHPHRTGLGGRGTPERIASFSHLIARTT